MEPLSKCHNASIGKLYKPGMCDVCNKPVEGESASKPMDSENKVEETATGAEGAEAKAEGAESTSAEATTGEASSATEAGSDAVAEGAGEAVAEGAEAKAE